jgi:hypothetical protein
VPTAHGIRIDDRQRDANIGKQPIKADEYQTVDAAEEKPLWRGPPQGIDLLAQHSGSPPQALLSVGAGRRAPTPASGDNVARFAIICEPGEVCDRHKREQ